MAAAHDRAVETAMAYAEEHVGYTRTGYHGRTRTAGRWAGTRPARGWCGRSGGTRRTGSPSRSCTPTSAVLNRLRTLSDGVIRALDGRGYPPGEGGDRHRVRPGVGGGAGPAARGVVFADRPDGKAREIVGVDPELCAEASTRRAQTLAKAEELTALYGPGLGFVSAGARWRPRAGRVTRPGDGSGVLGACVGAAGVGA